MRLERPPDHPRFGRAEPCECVLAEADDDRRQRLQRLSNLGTLTRFTFETLDPLGRSGESQGFATASQAARQYADAPVGWLVLTGRSGSGKTHLAAAIANQRIAEGQPVLFVVAPDLLDHLRRSYEPQEGELGYDSLVEQLRNAPLLIIDDVDAAAPTEWAREKLFQLVNHRFNAALPTVFTTTTPPPALEPRLATRLGDQAASRVLWLDAAEGAAYDQVGGMTRERLASMNFGNFDSRGAGRDAEERQSLEAAVRTATAYADDPRGWLTLQGVNGCGKTHLAAAIANRVLAASRSVFFAVVPDLLDQLRSSFAPGKEGGYDETFERIRNAGLLVLDDLGAQHTSPWAQEKLYQVVNYRSLGALPTLVTTDQPLEQLQAAHPRIVSRIADARSGVVVLISAPHYTLGPAPRRPRRP